MAAYNVRMTDDGSGGLSEEEKARRKAYAVQEHPSLGYVGAYGQEPYTEKAKTQEPYTEKVWVEGKGKSGWEAFWDWATGKGQGRGLLEHLAYNAALSKSGYYEEITPPPGKTINNFSGDKYAEAERRSKLTTTNVIDELGGSIGNDDRAALKYINDAKKYLEDNSPSAPLSPIVPDDKNRKNAYSLTPEQENVLNRAYSTARQSALSTKQGAISQAYDQYRRSTNPYGSVAENMASAGLSQQGGYSQYMNAQRFNAYANTANSAEQSYADTIANLDLSKAQSKLAYTEQNRSNAEAEETNKKNMAINIFERFQPTYDGKGNITKESKTQLTNLLREAGYTDTEIEALISFHRTR